MYTTENTYNDIMQGPTAPWVEMMTGKMMFINKSILSLIPEKYHDSSFELIGQKIKTPWGAPFPAQEIVDTANLSEEIFLNHIWEERMLWPEGREGIFNNTKEEVCLFTPIMKPEGKKPAVVICPGGAYMTLAMAMEGFATARAYAEHGYRPYVLRYRRTPENRFPEMQKDLTLAILYVLAHAEEDGTDPENLTIIGYSAGGHLCISTVSRIDEWKKLVLEDLPEGAQKETYRSLDPMPEKMCLGYAPHSLKCGSSALQGLCEENEAADYDGLNRLPGIYPKTYAWACEDDPLVKYTSTVEMEEAYTKAGICHKTHIYPTGGHGITFGEGTSAYGWFDEMMTFMEEE